ncbi:hypothetical protein [Enterococcus sp. AZ196]|uniref:hypothetical protein n=1 Tax=Enterococcus sp. AZ196 TaxID=2774659 RepID=UPI003D2779CF
MKYIFSSTIRTNNFTDDNVQEKIAGLWKKNESLVTQAKEQKIAGVYHDCESDYKGDYSLSIAFQTRTDDRKTKIMNVT